MLKNDLAETISLDGRWDFCLGKDPEGNSTTQGTVQTPGCWEAQGFSKFIDGPATYRRTIDLPASWEGQKIQVEFEAVSYQCTILFNGVQVGEHRGLWTPFAVDLTAAARPGEQNQLELIIYKPGERYPMRSSLAGFLPDIATTFGGIWQSARLRAWRVGLEDFQVQADYQEGCLDINCRAINLKGPLIRWHWIVQVFRGDRPITGENLPMPHDGRLDISLMLPEADLWQPEDPALYTVQVNLVHDNKTVARATQRTGFRCLSARGNQLLLNDQPFMVRGILSWGWEPDRIAPFYTAEQARQEMRRVKQMGFNLIKLCLFLPNQTYFDIADEEGVLLWEEFPMWLPAVTPELREQAPREYSDLARLLNWHPSVALFSLGCELNQSVDEDLLGLLNQVVHMQVRDVLVCDNSGSGESYSGLDYDFSDFTDYHPYYDIHYFEPLLDNWRRDWQAPRPWIFGEFCDSDTFRDLDEIIQANGGERPWWLTRANPVTTWRSESIAMLEYHKRLEKAHTGFTFQELTAVSYQQSQVTRKYTLESLRRKAGMGGYIITGLRDTPISTTGIWDDFYRPKWTASEFRQVNESAVLCLDTTRRRRWTYGGDRPERLDLQNLWAGETMRWYIILSLYGRELPAGSHLRWSLTNKEGDVFASGATLVNKRLLPGLPGEIGTISCSMPAVTHPTELHLKVDLTQDEFEVSNHWSIWVYPIPPEPPGELGIVDPAHLLDDWGDWLKPTPRVKSSNDLKRFNVLLSTVWESGLEKWVEEGGKVLLLQQFDGPLPTRRCPFWREAIKLFPPHPIWDSFPQRGYTDMQFFGMASDVAFNSEKLQEALPTSARRQPILRRLDGREFHMSEYLFEAGIGKGSLLGCSLRLQGGTGAQASGWQRNVAGSSMLWHLIEYLWNSVL